MSEAFLKHKFQSTKPPSPDPLKVGSVEQNEPHRFSGGIHGSLLMRDTGDLEEGANWLDSATAGKVLTSQGSGSAPSWSNAPVISSLTLTSPLGATMGGTGLSGYT